MRYTLSQANPTITFGPLSAPLTEMAVVTPTLSEGKTQADLKPAVEALVSALTSAQKAGGIGIVDTPIWGTLVENPEVYVVLVGWESAEVSQTVLSLLVPKYCLLRLIILRFQAFQVMMEAGKRGEGPIAEIAPKLRAVATVEFTLVKLA